MNGPDVERRLSDAQTISTRTSQISVVIFAAPILSWFGDFVPKLPAIRTAVALNGRVLRRGLTVLAQNRISWYRTQIGALELHSALDPGAESRLAEYRERLKAQINSLPAMHEGARNAEELAERSRKLAEQVKFKLFGLEFGVSGFWSPIVWLAALLLGCVNLALGRAAILDRCGGAVRALQWRCRFVGLRTLDT